MSPLPLKARCRPRSTEDMYPNLGPHAHAILMGSFTMLVIGQACMLFLIATLLISKRVRKRTATLLNLLFVIVEISIPPVLLFYSGQVFTQKPPFHLCYVQAMFKHGSDPMFCVASLAMILELLLEADVLHAPTYMSWSKRTRGYLLVAAPYIVFAVFSTWAGIIGHEHPDLVVHPSDQAFCTISVSSFARGILSFSIVVVMITISLEIYGIVKARQIWKDTPHLKPWNVSKLGVYLRLTAFTILQLFLFVLFATDFIWNTVPTHVLPIVYEALMPLISFLIYGTSRDTRAAWKFWGTRSQARGPRPLPEEVLMHSLRRGVESMRSSQTLGQTSHDVDSIAPEDHVIDISWENNHRT